MNCCKHRLAMLAGLAAVCGSPAQTLFGQTKDVVTPPSKAEDRGATSPEPARPEADRDRYQAAKKALLANWATVRSLTLHIATEGEFQRADILERTEGGGTYDYLKKNGVVYVRAERRSQSVSIPGQTHVSGPSNWALMVSDGSSVYTHQKRGSKEHIFKDTMEFHGLPHMGAEEFFAELEAFDIRQQLPDQKLGTHDCYVFRAHPESGNPVLTYHLDKKLGVLLRFHIDDHSNQRFNTLAVEQMEINPTFRANHFKFNRPEAVPFTDRTSNGKPPEAKKTDDAPPAGNKPD